MSPKLHASLNAARSATCAVMTDCLTDQPFDESVKRFNGAVADVRANLNGANTDVSGEGDSERYQVLSETVSLVGTVAKSLQAAALKLASQPKRLKEEMLAIHHIQRNLDRIPAQQLHRAVNPQQELQLIVERLP